MSEAVHERYEQLQVETVLDRYAGLRITPTRADELRLVGPLAFQVKGPDGETIEDEYDVEIRVSPRFPVGVPLVRETGGRIDEAYHKLDDGALCLGAPTELRLILQRSPTLVTFVERILIPYLYGHSYCLKHGKMPYGELGHGHAGIRDFFAATFGACGATRPEEFLRLAGLQKRRANKQPCPCDSGFRLGRCHNRRVNNFRTQMGRLWCRDEYLRVMKMLKPQSDSEWSLFRGRTRVHPDVKRGA